MISKICQNLAFSNFGQIGTCFTQFVFGGDIGLATLVVLSVFVGFIVRYNMPANLLLPISVALAYLAYMASGGLAVFLVFLILTLAINGVLIAIGILNYINR